MYLDQQTGAAHCIRWSNYCFLHFFSASFWCKREKHNAVPLEVLRDRIQYHSCQILCTLCYGKHLRKYCDQSQITWLNYVQKFMEEFPQMLKSFYGRWQDQVNKCPLEKENYNIYSYQPLHLINSLRLPQDWVEN